MMCCDNAVTLENRLDMWQWLHKGNSNACPQSNRVIHNCTCPWLEVRYPGPGSSETSNVKTYYSARIGRIFKLGPKKWRSAPIVAIVTTMHYSIGTADDGTIRPINVPWICFIKYFYTFVATKGLKLAPDLEVISRMFHLCIHWMHKDV